MRSGLSGLDMLKWLVIANIMAGVITAFAVGGFSIVTRVAPTSDVDNLALVLRADAPIIHPRTGSGTREDSGFDVGVCFGTDSSPIRRDGLCRFARCAPTRR